MWPILKAVVFAALLCVCVRAQGSSQQQQPGDPCGDPLMESMTWHSVEGKVIEVLDGDTVVMKFKDDRLLVDLVGIESPSMNKPFGMRAQLFLERLVKDKNISVLVNPSDWGEGWGRPTPKKILGVVHVEEPQILSVNLELIRAGLARHKKAPSYKMSDYTECWYIKAEEKAREEKVGLWATLR